MTVRCLAKSAGLASKWEHQDLPRLFSISVWRAVCSTACFDGPLGCTVCADMVWQVLRDLYILRQYAKVVEAAKSLFLSDRKVILPPHALRTN